MKPGMTSLPRASISRSPLGSDAADRRDLSPTMATSASKRRAAGAIDDGAAADHERIGHSAFLQRLLLDSRPPFGARSTLGGWGWFGVWVETSGFRHAPFRRTTLIEPWFRVAAAITGQRALLHELQ